MIGATIDTAILVVIMIELGMIYLKISKFSGDKG
jgi:hypothetical protein